MKKQKFYLTPSERLNIYTSAKRHVYNSEVGLCSLLTEAASFLIIRANVPSAYYQMEQFPEIAEQMPLGRVLNDEYYWWPSYDRDIRAAALDIAIAKVKELI